MSINLPNNFCPKVHDIYKIYAFEVTVPRGQEDAYTYNMCAFKNITDSIYACIAATSTEVNGKANIKQEYK